MRERFENIKTWFNKGYTKIIIFEVILLIVLLFTSFVFKIANMYKLSLILLPFLIVAILLFGYEKTRFRNKKDVLINILIFILVYYLITYMLGLFTGFLRSAYSMHIVSILKNMSPLIIYIIVGEVLRYVLFTKSKGSILCLVLGYIIFTLIDVNAAVHLYNVFTYSGLTKMICLVIFPSMTKNIMLIYLVRRVGYANGIVYRLVTEATTYILPIIPDFGEYITVVLKTILPIIIVVRINTMFNYFEERKIKTSRYNSKKMIAYTVITMMLFVVVTLTSGYFKYQALSIGSGSMSPKIQIGDVVIVGKVPINKLDRIKKGDILVYDHEKRIIVHRVVKIINKENKYSFMTKGDNNNTKDAWIVHDKEVIGIVKFKIKWIGMPTVALNELLSR